ncbi:MAG: sulfur oxidation c-type cytochrome SoxX [Pseudomonadota bacterium]|nr:sulfur oxidation c-type cytochrome SoxX [Pseudomonadota bacterium]
MKKISIFALGTAGALAAGCAAMMSGDEQYADKALAMMKTSFKERGQAKLDRLDQDDMQRMCSAAAEKPVAKDVAERLEKAQQALLKYPADGKYLGDWKAGERIAQSGQGKQFSDNPANPNGANCYACHQLSKAELSFGTIGPTLYNFGKLRGFTPEMQKYAYSKVYNSQAFSACSNMPRFGHAGILTEKQIQDVVALLMDPESPINK